MKHHFKSPKRSLLIACGFLTLSAVANGQVGSELNDEAEKLEEGLVVYQIKTQDHVESTVVRRGEGKLIDYYDQGQGDQSVFTDGEIGSTGQLRLWKLSR